MAIKTRSYVRSILMLFIASLMFQSCKKESNAEYVQNILSPSDPDNPNSIIGPMSPIEDMPYPEISNSEYIIELDRWDIPSNRKDAVKTTDNLQAAIDWAVAEGYGKIRLPKGHYLIGKYGNDIYQAGIELKSNMAFLMDENAIIEMAPNNKWNYCAIAVTQKAHVLISGGTILGDRDAHVYTPRANGSAVHDEGHLICIQNESEYVTVENVVMGKANGDGILLVGQMGPGSSVKNIVIRHNNIVDNRRQGISIVGGVDVLIEDNEIHHTKGTSPQFGIDVESLSYTSKDIIINSNFFHHNRGGDIVNTDGRNVLVEHNILEQGEGSSYIDGPLVYWKKGDLTIRYNDITLLTPTVNNWNGIIMYSNDSPKTNPATTYIYENICHSCGFYMYKGADLDIRDNLLLKGHLAFWRMENLTLENNKVEHPDVCWAYRFKEVSGVANNNTYNDDYFHIPLSNVPWDGCWY